jgi:glutamate synthase domain-containing protein 2
MSYGSISQEAKTWRFMNRIGGKSSEGGEDPKRFQKT